MLFNWCHPPLCSPQVIRNEALVLMINLTRSAQEIQKIVVFEGAFEKAFNIAREEGGADGGIVVQVGEGRGLGSRKRGIQEREEVERRNGKNSGVMEMRTLKSGGEGGDSPLEWVGGREVHNVNFTSNEEVRRAAREAGVGGLTHPCRE